MSEGNNKKRVETIKFDPNCPFCWFRTSGVLSTLVYTGELDEYDNLLLGAGDIVTSTSIVVVDSDYRGACIFEDVFEDTFFADMTEWLHSQGLADFYLDVDEVTRDVALHVKAVVDLALHMNNARDSSLMLAA